MDTVTINVRIRMVGNSLALFLPAWIKEKLGVRANDEIVASIFKKKQRINLRGLLKDRKIEFKEEDRLDGRY